MSVRELFVTYGKAGVGQNGNRAVVMTDAKAVAATVAPLLEREACEVGYALCVTAKMELIGYHEVSRGSLDATVMHPREIFKAAVLVNAAALILVHNHPSGDPSPSPDDIGLTARLKQAGEILGIQFLDHIIIGHHGRFVSLKERGDF